MVNMGTFVPIAMKPNLTSKVKSVGSPVLILSKAAFNPNATSRLALVAHDGNRHLHLDA